MRHILITAAIILSLPLAPAIGQETKNGVFTEFSVLWDRAQGGPSHSPNGGFCDLGAELMSMGATITDLTPGGRYTDKILEGYDLVIICLREQHMLASEQVALVRYVRNGGGLLVLCKYGATISACNPVLINFGIQVTVNILNTEHLNTFVNPATTSRRPVDDCEVWEPRSINLSGGATSIAGYNSSVGLASITNCVFALGGNCGRGRIIATGNTNMWLSKPSVCGPVRWGRADNTALLHNVVEYLLGASDLRMLKFSFRKRLSAGRRATLKTRVKNLESCYSRGAELGFYLSEDRIFDSYEDIYLGSATIPELKGGKSKKLKVKAAIPDDVQPGNYYLLAVVNHQGQPLEVNAGNNVAARRVTVE